MTMIATFWRAARSLDPSRVRRIFVTHADADHAGATGYFSAEFNTEVYIHPGSRGVIENINRAHGLTGRLANLNRYYTRLINAFTGCRFPADMKYFSTRASGHLGGFDIIDNFEVGDLRFDVLESRGGHIPGHVFFLERSAGLMYSSDYLINPGTLTAKDKSSLGVYRYLLTTPNSDSQVYKDETAALKGVILGLKHATVFPGHGGTTGRRRCQTGQNRNPTYPPLKLRGG